MSLANDILKHTGSLMPKGERARPTRLAYPKTKKPVVKAPLPTTDIPGVSWSCQTKKWKAYFYDGIKSHTLGEFTTPERAGLAVTLYKFWRKRGFRTTDHRKPSFRTYTRKIAD